MFLSGEACRGVGRGRDPPDRDLRKRIADPPGVSRGHTSGRDTPNSREGPNVRKKERGQDQLVNASYDRSQPTLWACLEGEAVNPPSPAAERSGVPALPEHQILHPARTQELWEEVFSKANLYRALHRVEQNGGSPGIDGMEVKELRPYLKAFLAQDPPTARLGHLPTSTARSGFDP